MLLSQHWRTRSAFAPGGPTPGLNWCQNEVEKTRAAAEEDKGKRNTQPKRVRDCMPNGRPAHTAALQSCTVRCYCHQEGR